MRKETFVSFKYKEKELKTSEEMPILQPGTSHINSARIQLRHTIVFLLEKSFQG